MIMVNSRLDQVKKTSCWESVPPSCGSEEDVVWLALISQRWNSKGMWVTGCNAEPSSWTLDLAEVKNVVRPRTFHGNSNKAVRGSLHSACESGWRVKNNSSATRTRRCIWTVSRPNITTVLHFCPDLSLGIAVDSRRIPLLIGEVQRADYFLVFW